MQFRIFSDLHRDVNRGNSIIHKMENEKDQVLLYAGDLAPFQSRNFMNDLHELSARFRKVVFVPGNHEFYGGIFQESKFPKSIFQHYPNVHLLGLGGVYNIIIDDVKIVGMPLWTNFFNRDPNQETKSMMIMNDFKMIRSNEHNGFISATEMADESESQKECIRELTHNSAHKTIVVTHHAPIMRSIHSKFARSPINGAFCNNYESLFDEDISLWIHGHTHSYLDYFHNKTRVICNPYGYRNENKTFNHYLTVELEG